MKCCRRIVLVWMFSVGLGASAQLPSVRAQAQKASTPAPAAAAPAPAPEANDPLGRRIPRGTVLGFLQYAQTGNYKAAADYLQMTKNSRATDGERLAEQLHRLLDRAYAGNVGRISDQQEGSVQPGVPPDEERIGTFEVIASSKRYG